jgi:CDP-glucose 4,6-dehydratase
VTQVHGDLSDAALLHRAMAEHEVTFCFHLAAQALVGVADRSPVGTFATNAMGTVHLLDACRLTGVQQCVIASSDKAYGSSADLPYREDMPLLGEGPYEASKVCTEIIARSFAATYGMRMAVARCANVYGGGDMNFSRLVPDTIRSVLAGRNPVLRSDGSPRRDYLYASDAAGAGRPTREIDDQYLDSSRARARLAWEPVVDLRSGLSLAIDWYRRYLAADRPQVPAAASAASEGAAG